jgi:organic hydroperoxide reductase OsmC/OhrA
MENQYSYATEVEWIGERRGDVSAPHRPDLKVDAPPEFKGTKECGPRSVSSSLRSIHVFMTTFLAIAETSKLEFVRFSADAKGKLEKLDGRGFIMTEVVLRPKLRVCHARDVERAGRILENNDIATEIHLISP